MNPELAAGLWKSLEGGVFIGLSAILLLIFHGRIAGISGIVNGIIHWHQSDSKWRVYFVLGLLLGGVFVKALAPESFDIRVAQPMLLVVAGLAVGFGTVLGSGCTSGHGVCGVSRASKRSLIATLIFMVSGMVMVALLRWCGVLPEVLTEVAS